MNTNTKPLSPKTRQKIAAHNLAVAQLYLRLMASKKATVKS